MSSITKMPTTHRIKPDRIQPDRIQSDRIQRVKAEAESGGNGACAEVILLLVAEIEALQAENRSLREIHDAIGSFVSCYDEYARAEPEHAQARHLALLSARDQMIDVFRSEHQGEPEA